MTQNLHIQLPLPSREAFQSVRHDQARQESSNMCGRIRTRIRREDDPVQIELCHFKPPSKTCSDISNVATHRKDPTDEHPYRQG